jgi:hypothetical protein
LSLERLIGVCVWVDGAVVRAIDGGQCRGRGRSGFRSVGGVGGG